MRRTIAVGDICGSHGCGYTHENYVLLGCNAMQFGKQLPRFRKSHLPTSSGEKDSEDGSSRFLDKLVGINI
jgi:hypothetical protein